jgi:hypothetical protein
MFSEGFVMGRHLVTEWELSHQPFGLWMVKRLGRISHDPVEIMGNRFGINALEVSEGPVP